MTEKAALRNVTHEQFNHYKELMHGLEEPGRSACGGRASDRLLEVGVRVGVVELHGANTTKVVMVARELRVAR